MDSEELRQLLRQPEGLKLEFKSKLYEVNHLDNKVRRLHWGEFIKDILALANGNVGVARETAYLIIGAGDKLKADGTRDLYDVGDIDIGRIRRQILDKVNAVCDPPLQDIRCDIVALEERRIFAVSIPPSPHLHETTRRLETSGGKAYPESMVFIRRAEGIFPARASERRAIQADKQTGVLKPTPPLVHIPAGPFWMGSSLEDAEAHDNEKPRRQLYLREYLIGRYPVTSTQYARFVHDTGHRIPEHWDKGKVPASLEDHPVVNVSHSDAEVYCRWLSQVTGEHYRLPTEEEWEKAARSVFPEVRRYPWGDEWESGICNTQELGRDGTISVHEFEQDNRSPFGVVDMAGNVWEWTAGLYKPYSGFQHESSSQHGESRRVVRGGSWRHSHWCARISCRGRYEPDVRRPYVGFRIVLEALD